MRCIDPAQGYGGSCTMEFYREVNGAPILRGLALSVMRGKMFLASPDPIAGPDGVCDRDVATIPEVVTVDLIAEPESRKGLCA